jgi:hypothetical protein
MSLIEMKCVIAVNVVTAMAASQTDMTKHPHSHQTLCDLYGND